MQVVRALEGTHSKGPAASRLPVDQGKHDFAEGQQVKCQKDVECGDAASVPGRAGSEKHDFALRQQREHLKDDKNDKSGKNVIRLVYQQYLLTPFQTSDLGTLHLCILLFDSYDLLQVLALQLDQHRLHYLDFLLLVQYEFPEIGTGKSQKKDYCYGVEGGLRDQLGQDIANDDPHDLARQKDQHQDVVDHRVTSFLQSEDEYKECNNSPSERDGIGQVGSSIGLVRQDIHEYDHPQEPATHAHQVREGQAERQQHVTHHLQGTHHREQRIMFAVECACLRDTAVEVGTVRARITSNHTNKN